MIVTDERVALFVAQQIKRPINPPYTAMGIERDGDLIAGVIFNNWTISDIHMTAAGRGWSRGFIAGVGEYVFGQLKCQRITVVTEQPAVVRLAERLGGKVEGMPRNQFGPGRNGFLVGILAQDWKYQ